MTVYLVNIALILFWRLYFAQKKFLDARKYYCAIVAIQWILISGLRDLGIGADTYNYYTIFESTKRTSWGTVFGNLFQYSLQNTSERDPGYTVITKLFQLFSGNYQLFMITIAVFFITLMAIWIYKNSSSPCTSYLVFSTLFYAFYAITGHRQTIATALVSFVGYDLIKRQKLWKFMVVAFAAFLIHKSSLVFMPMYFISRIPVTTGYMILCAVVIGLVAIAGKSLYGPIAMWIGYGEGFIDYAEGGAELYASLLIALCLVTWILYPKIRQHRKDAPLLFHVNSMALLSALLVVQNQSFMRIQQYFSLFIMITVPEVINTVRKEYRLLVYLLFGTVMILYLMYNNPQYQFFFMS